MATCITSETISRDLENKTVYLFGASDDTALIELLEQYAVYPAAVFDNDKEKIGAAYHGRWPIRPAAEIASLAGVPGTVVVINANAHQAICNKLQQQGFSEDQLFLRENRTNFFTESGCLKNIDLCITQKCSLRCAHCSNLMQYYGEQSVPAKHFEYDVIEESMYSLFRGVNRIMHVNLLGGESFLHPQLARILKYLVGREEVGRINILTNGTIIPRNDVLPILCDEKIFIKISVYPISAKYQALTEVFTERGIAFSSKNTDVWYDIGEIRDRGLSKAQVCATYQNCCMQLQIAVQENKIYPCAVYSHAVKLGLMPEHPEDIIDMASETGEAIAEKLRDFFSRPYFHGCAYCERPWTRELTAAEQLL